MILNTNIIEGDQEPLFGDITGFAEKCEEQGVDHSLDIAAVSPFSFLLKLCSNIYQ